MTVIACKDGVMAADTGIWQGLLVCGYASKIVRLPDGGLFAACGAHAAAVLCAEWLAGEREKPEPEEEGSFGALMLSPNGIWHVDYKLRIYKSPSAIAAEGSHTEFLLGAMYAGASAEEAVRLAIKHGDCAAGEVQVEYL